MKVSNGKKQGGIPLAVYRETARHLQGNFLTQPRRISLVGGMQMVCILVVQPGRIHNLWDCKQPYWPGIADCLFHPTSEALCAQ